jgi:hypothetical protein
MNFYLYLFILIKLLVNFSNADRTNSTNDTHLQGENLHPQSIFNSTIDALNEFIRLTKENLNKTEEIPSKQNSINFNVNFNFGLKKERLNNSPADETPAKKHNKNKEKFTVVWLDGENDNRFEKKVEQQVDQERIPAKYFFRFTRPQENLVHYGNEQSLQKLPFKPLRSAERPLNYFPYLSYDDRLLKNWMRKRNTHKSA